MAQTDVHPETDTTPELTIDDRLLAALDSEEEQPTDGEPEAERSASPPANESGDGDEADGEQDEPEAAQEPPIELDDSLELEIEGEKVTLAELKASRFRQSDYTRKTQQLAEVRKATEQARAEAARERELYATELGKVQEWLKQTAGPEPDWDKLATENPTEYARRWADHQRRQQEIQAVEHERQRLFALQQEEASRQLREIIVHESERLVEAVPEWKDEAVATAEKGKLREFAHSLGFTDTDLGNIYDHRILLILRDAMRYREQTTKVSEVKAKVAEKAATTKVLQPGGRNTGQPDRQKQQLRRSREKLARSGRVEDAVGIISGMLD